jgi:hypothetical protein
LCLQRQKRTELAEALSAEGTLLGTPSIRQSSRDSSIEEEHALDAISGARAGVAGLFEIPWADEEM